MPMNEQNEAGRGSIYTTLEESVALNQLLLELYRRERNRRRILEALCVLCACAAIGAWLL